MKKILTALILGLATVSFVSVSTPAYSTNITEINITNMAMTITNMIGLKAKALAVIPNSADVAALAVEAVSERAA